MLYVYIILGIIVVLFITVVILAIRKYNNEEVSKELEYVSENYNVDEINEQANVGNSTTVQNNVVNPVNTRTQEVVKEEKPSGPVTSEPVQAPVVDNTPPPVIDLKVPERTDEEILVEDKSLKEETTSESIEIKDNALNGEETGEEISIVDNSLKVEENEDAAVVIPDVVPVKDEIKVNEIPKDNTDYKNQAFNNSFDGNTTINKDIKVEDPKPKDLNKTEIWDMSEVREVLNSNEKN